MLADHHSFMFGSSGANTAAIRGSGSAVEWGVDFVRVLTGVANGPVNVVFSNREHPEGPSLSRWEVVEECGIHAGGNLELLSSTADGLTEQLGSGGFWGVRVSARNRDTSWDLDVADPVEEYLVELWPTDYLHPFAMLKKVDAAWPVESGADDVDDAAAGDDAGLRLRSKSIRVESAAGPRFVRAARSDDPDDAPELWGGVAPSMSLKQLLPGQFRNAAKSLAFVDRGFLDEIVDSEPSRQRAIARWSAARAYERAGVADLEWMKPVMDALESGAPVPESFTADPDLYSRFESDPRVPRQMIKHFRGGPDHLSWLYAMSAAQWAQHEDPVHAVLLSVMAAVQTYGTDYPQFIAALRKHLADT
nr:MULTISPECIES: hypothetical protein [unclassified Rhodococcus (in: high G+C Gram-positive bacteria)]